MHYTLDCYLIVLWGINILVALPPEHQKTQIFLKNIYYRLSRARRIVKNCFGFLVQRWRLLNRRIHLNKTNVVHFIKAACILHTYLRETPEYQDRATLQVNRQGTVIIPPGAPVMNIVYLRGYHSALTTRELFKNYFNGLEISVPWQLEQLI